MSALIDLYLRDTVTRLRPGDPDQWGEPGAATETALAARITYESRWIKVEGGEAVQAVARLRLAPDASAAHTDRWRLPNDAREYATLRIGRKTGWADMLVEVDLG